MIIIQVLFNSLKTEYEARIITYKGNQELLDMLNKCKPDTHFAETTQIEFVKASQVDSAVPVYELEAFGMKWCYDGCFVDGYLYNGDAVTNVMRSYMGGY